MRSLDGSHEAIAMGHTQRRHETAQFYRVVVPETREVARQALATMMGQGTLRQSSATRLFRDLWQNPADYFAAIRASWKARPAE